MGRISASLSGIERALLSRLNESNAAAELTALRLASNARIMRPKLDPTGFVALDGYRARLSAVNASTSNVAAAQEISSGAQATVDAIRAQLDLIRTKAVADETGTLTADERAANQTAIDDAVGEIRRLASENVGGRKLFDGSADYAVSGRNSSQVARVEVDRLGSPTVLAAQSSGELVYTGRYGRVVANATVTFNGPDGSTQVVMTTADSLAEVARAINVDTGNSGLTATADGNTLRIRSVAKGEDVHISRVVNSGLFTVSGSGDGAEVTLADGPSIAGEVLSAATRAELTYTGAAGAINSGAATISLTGQRGSESIAVTNGQSLSSVASAINAKSHKTGVTAAVDGNTLTFSSVDYGYAATAAVAATSGTFAVSGGEDGVARGSDARLVLNGQTIIGNQAAQSAELTHHEFTGNIVTTTQFTLTGDLGSAPISLTAGNTLAQAAQTINLETASTGVSASVSSDGKTLQIRSVATGEDANIAIAVTSGTFALSGGNGDGTAVGDEANTNPAVRGNRVSFADNGTSFTIELAPGFEGELDTISLSDGGKLEFAFSPDVLRTVDLTLPSLAPELLGGPSGSLDALLSGGTASGLDANASLAIRIVDEAIGDLDRTTGRVDGFADAAVASSADLLDAWADDLDDAIESVNGIDEAEQEQLQLHYLSLADNALSGLAILQQQRLGIVEILRQAAGLD